MSPTTWNDELKALIAEARSATETARLLAPAVSEGTASDVLPQEAPGPGTSLFRTLQHELRSIEGRAAALFDRLSSQPAALFVSGHRLSAEEFYALRCAGIGFPVSSSWGLPGWEEYELYTLMHYEDESRIGWINPDRPPPDERRQKLGMRFGLAPESVRVSRLRPEQVVFFRTFLPGAFTRFQSD